MSESTLSVPVPAAMPGEAEIARALIAHFVEYTGFATVNEDGDKTSVAACYGGNWIDLRVYPIARAILDLFAPILAEKERLEGIAEAYAACESVARKLVDHIDPALEERLPALCEISRETWLAHKQRAPIMAVDMLHHAQLKAAEAALAGERERCITAYASYIGVALQKYDENLRYGDDALGPELFFEEGMERAAAAIRAQGE